MRKFIAIGIASFVMAFPALAQNNPEEKQTYVQQVQKFLDQQNQKSQKQFEQRYPKPVAPTISSGSQMSGSAQAYKPPVSRSGSGAQQSNTYSSNNSYASSSESIKTPDVAVGGERKEQNTQMNIFVPQGSNTTTQAPNPYR
jgi:hypothetical protein